MRFLAEEQLLALRDTLEKAKAAGTINQTEFAIITQPLIHPSNLNDLVGNEVAIAALQRMADLDEQDALLADFIAGLKE